MTYDIAAALNLEIKKEMADRYFSFRKLIERDTEALNQAVADAAEIEQVVAIDLSRIYIMLHDEQLIETFLQCSGLNTAYYFDPHILASPTIRERMFQDISVWGLTRKSRFTKVFLNCYDDLCRHIDIFRSLRAELAEEQEVISQEIDMFYRQNDISSILGFFRSMDSMSKMGSTMEGSINSGFDESLVRKMQIIAPHPVDQGIDPLPPLVPAEQIKKELKVLAKSALKHQSIDFTK